MGCECDYSQFVISVHITVLNCSLSATCTRTIEVVEQIVMGQGRIEISDED